MAEHNWRLLSIILCIFFNEAWSPESPDLAVVDDEDAFPMCLLFACSRVARMVSGDDGSLSLVALLPAWFRGLCHATKILCRRHSDDVRRRLKHFLGTKQLNVA